MRQAGYIAAAGLYALDHHIGRLADDHARARTLAAALGERSYVARMMPAETNIVIAQLHSEAQALISFLKARGILASAMGPRMVRFVFHLDIDDSGLDQILQGVRAFGN